MVGIEGDSYLVAQQPDEIGTIIVQGGRFGGWSLYVKDGVPAYDYNFLGLERTTVAGTEELKPGQATIRVVGSTSPNAARANSSGMCVCQMNTTRRRSWRASTSRRTTWTMPPRRRSWTSRRTPSSRRVS